MLPVSAAILEQLTAAYRRGERLVLVFDYDGALTPLVAHLSLARPKAAVRTATPTFNEPRYPMRNR